MRGVYINEMVSYGPSMTEEVNHAAHETSSVVLSWQQQDPTSADALQECLRLSCGKGQSYSTALSSCMMARTGEKGVQ